MKTVLGSGIIVAVVMDPVDRCSDISETGADQECCHHLILKLSRGRVTPPEIIFHETRKYLTMK